MQLNFLGLVVAGAGVVILGLGISGNYKSFGKSLAAGVKAGGFGPGETKAPDRPTR